jgi:hypothetical protein
LPIIHATLFNSAFLANLLPDVFAATNESNTLTATDYG